MSEPFDPKEADALAAEYAEKAGARVSWIAFDVAKEIGVKFNRPDGTRHGVRVSLRHLTLSEVFAEAKDAFDAWSVNNPPRSEA